MHIKVVVFGAVGLALAAFFGYIAYKDLIFNGAALAEEKIMQKMADPALAAEVESGSVAGQPVYSAEFYGLKRAEIALREYQKNVVEQPRGCNCGPEIDKYTGGTPVQWCTLFASWVGKEAGSGVTNPKTGSWQIVNSRDFAEYLKSSGTWYSREEVVEKELTPEIGDYIVFWRGSFEDNLGHVDIVVEDGSVPGTAGLVGGNLRDRVDYRENFPYLQNYGFLGFGRPEK